jgi:hypothetical protein
VYSGDEPHYVLVLTSLLRDGDLDVGNNYDNARRSGPDAGEVWRGARNLDNHTVTVVDGKQVFFEKTYQIDAPIPEWRDDGSGRVVPPVRPGKEPFPPGAVEWSAHQSGVAFLLYPLLYPFRESDRIESAALACSGLAVVGGFLAFRWLCCGLGAGPWRATGVAALAFLATPVWYYARSLFLEGFILFGVVTAFACYLRRGWVLLPGLLIAAATQCKAYVALLAVPIAADLLARRRWGAFAGYSAAVGLGAAGVLGLNWYCFGHPLTTAQPFVMGSFREGAWGQLLSPTYGLFWVCPAAIFAVVAWPHFARTRPRDAALLLTPILLVYLFIAFFTGWRGMCYGPRYLVPVLPFLFAPLAGPRPDTQTGRGLGWQLAAVLIAASVAINAWAAFDHWWVWYKNPALEFFARLRERPQ